MTTSAEQGRHFWGGGWKTWRFQRNLGLQPTGVWDPGTRVSTGAVQEEGLETLLMLNLDSVFRGWALRLNEKHSGVWAGADIQATDPSGCRHLFEVKYGADPGSVVDQALAYALDVIGGKPTRFFDEQPAESRSVFLACRAAGFWKNSRSDKWATDGAARPSVRRRKALEGFAATNELDIAELLGDGRWWSDRLADQAARCPSEAYSRIPTNLHFHVVVPDPSKLGVGQLQSLANLAKRGVTASIWQAAIQRGDESGQLSVRPIWLLETPAELDDRFHVSKVIALAGLHDPALNAMLAEQRLRWTCFGDSHASLGDHWHGPTPKLTIEMVLDSQVALRTEVVVQKFLLQSSEGIELAQQRRSAVSDWACRVAPPADAAIAARLEGNSKKKLVWTSACPKTGLALEASRTPGGSSVTFTKEADIETVAKVVARSVRALLEAAAKHQAGFGLSSQEMAE